MMIYFTPQGRCAAVWGWGKKLTTHVHLVVKLRMVDVYTYSSMCLHGINRDSFFSPCSAVQRCRLTPSADIDRQTSETVNSYNQNKTVQPWLLFCFEFVLFPLLPISVSDYKEESTPWEDGGSSLASKEILHILWDLGSLPCSQEPITSPCPEPD